MTVMPHIPPLAIVAAVGTAPGVAGPYPADRLARCPAAIAARLRPLQARLLPPPPVPAASFRIPPIYERAVSGLTLNLLWLAREAFDGRRFGGDLERTDIFVAISGGFDCTLRNALKIDGISLLEATEPDRIASGRQLLQQHFGSTTHDKVGEMASIIAARIGIETKAHGRILAFENAEAGMISALEAAALNLADGSSDMVVLGVGQRIEGAHMALALQEHFGPELVLEEGASLFVLRRLEDALRDQDSVLGVIDGLNLVPMSATTAQAPALRRQNGAAQGRGYGLAHGVATDLRIALDSLSSCNEVTLSGETLHGQSWRLHLSRAALSRPPQKAQPSHNAPLAILGTGASYGPFSSRAAVRLAFAQGHDGIAPIRPTTLPRATAFDPQKQAPLTSYAELGAETAPAKSSPAHGPHDPVQRLAYHVAAEALREAKAEASWGRWSIIIAGQLCSVSERRLSNAIHRPELENLLDLPVIATAMTAPPQTSLNGLFLADLASRLAEDFGLPACGLALESACASSLAALDLARAQLRSGRYDAVLVVAAELPINQRDLTLCSAQRMLSADRIAPFSEQADGFSPGDGAGAVVLRRMADCAAFAGQVQGVIRGVGGASDAMSFTAPDASGQVRAMRRALQDAGVEAGSVRYVEAHGTGTQRGDRIEIEALNTVYAGQSDGPIGLGSVKSMIGHSFAAAGMAGLFRALHAVQSGETPPTILRGKLNAGLGLETGPWQIRDSECPTTDKTPRPDPLKGPRRAAVNALGTGGTNFHLIVEAPPATASQSKAEIA